MWLHKKKVGTAIKVAEQSLMLGMQAPVDKDAPEDVIELPLREVAVAIVHVAVCGTDVTDTFLVVALQAIACVKMDDPQLQCLDELDQTLRWRARLALAPGMVLQRRCRGGLQLVVQHCQLGGLLAGVHRRYQMLAMMKPW